MGRSEHFYHGTAQAIEGDVIRPAADVGKEISPYTSGDPGGLSTKGDHAFAIRGDEDYAWHAAKNFHVHEDRARVYEVEPAKHMTPGPWNPANSRFKENLENRGYSPDTPGQDEWASRSGFKIKGRIDIMPGHQGTFPEVDWNKLKEGGRGPDANHPVDDQVQYGLRGHPQRRLGDVRAERPAHLSHEQFVDWGKDNPPHSPLREAAGRPQKRWATLFD